MKNPEERATASELLRHEFIRDGSGPPGRLVELIREAQQMRERLAENVMANNTSTEESDSRTMVSTSGGVGGAEEESGTLVRHGDSGDESESGGTMIQHATFVPEAAASAAAGAATAGSNVESYLGTMVINDDEEEDEDTMKSERKKYHR